MARFDIENFRDYFIAMIKDNLAAKLAEINAEKADSLTLEVFDNDQYAGSLSEKVMNYADFVLYGFPEIQTIQQPDSGDFAIEIQMTFDIWIADTDGGIVAENKVLRYTRAFSEIIAENIRKNPIIGDVQLEIFSPLPLSLSQFSAIMRVGGVQIKGTIA